MASEKNREKPRKRSRVTDEDRVRLALKRYTITPERTTLWSNEEIAEAEGLHSSVVSKAINSAFTKQLVKIVPTEKPNDTPIKRDAALGSTLLLGYKGLKGARVIETPSIFSDTTDPTSSDNIHRLLGEYAAKEISEGLLIEPDGVIGLGGGRGVFYFVEALRRYARLRLGKCEVVSLTGAVHAQDHSGQVNGHLDADLHASLFGLCLETPRRPIHLMSLPITFENQDILQKERFKSPIGNQNWSSRVPNYAIVGVGIFGPGHRFFDAVENHRDTIFSPLHRDLIALVELCKKYTRTSPSYCPIGDICNRLFLIPDPEQGLQGKPEEDIDNLVKKINSRLINVEIEQLSQIRNIILIAGTAVKAIALRHILKLGDPKFNIRMLYTDSTAAAELVALKSHYGD